MTRSPRLRGSKRRCSQISLALVLGFTLVKNANYALAESRATSAAASSDVGRLEIAMQSIDSAIAIAPDVGRYRVIRANILDRARNSTAAKSDQAKMAVEAYQTNGRAVAANPFDLYNRLNFAESALTLAAFGQPDKGEEAIEEYRRLTLMQPRFWLSHFLLGRAYLETGEPDRAVAGFSGAIRLNPMSTLIYDRRAEAYELLGEYGLAVNDYDRTTELRPDDPSQYVLRGVALFALGRLEESVQNFDEAIELYNRMIGRLVVSENKSDEAVQFVPLLALAYNNRGSAYYEAGQVERAFDDYTESIRLNPRLGEAFYNRATAFAVLGKDAEARRDLLQAEALGTTIPN